jgi:hypothetical protein
MSGTGLTQRKVRHTQSIPGVEDPSLSNQHISPTSASQEALEDDEKKERQLTLMEQILLLGLKDSQVISFFFYKKKHFSKNIYTSPLGNIVFLE